MLSAMPLNIVRLRGIDIPDAIRTRVESCTDLDLLTTWSRRALRVTTAQELTLVDETLTTSRPTPEDSAGES